MTSKAVIYCRVSTKEQVQNLSLPTQLKACRAYCDHNGFDVVEEFEDRGESAKTTDRPEFQRLLAFCRANKRRVQYVVVYNISRFSRKTQDHLVIRALLAQLGILLRSVNEPLGEDPVGKLTETMLSAIAQFDNDQKAARTKAGMLAALERGRWTWRPPLGYLSGSARSGEASLRPDPDRAHHVRRAFELVGSGRCTVNDALRAVTAAGLRSQTGKPLTPQTFGALLKNPICAGWLTVRSLGVNRVRGDFEALIAEPLFERVQRALKRPGDRSQRHRNHPGFPLRRFVRCGECNTPLTGSAPRGRSKSYPYYHCRRCKRVSIRTESLERQFVGLLESLKPRHEVMTLFRAIVTDIWKTRFADARIARASLDGRLAALQQREDRLEEAFVFEKAIDSVAYERQRDKIREDIAVVRLELEDARIEELDVEEIVGFAEHVICDAARLWRDSPLEQRQRLQSAIFPEGLSFEDGRLGTA